MNEITNKHIFITMIIIGLVTMGLIIPLYNNRSVSGTSYSYNGSINTSLLGATAYNADYSGPQTNSLINNRYPYQAVISKSYYPVNTSTTTTTGSSYDSYYYYSTSGGTRLY